MCGVTRGEHAKYGCNTGNTLQNVVQYNYDIITSQCINKKKMEKLNFLNSFITPKKGFTKINFYYLKGQCYPQCFGSGSRSGFRGLLDPGA